MKTYNRRIELLLFLLIGIVPFGFFTTYTIAVLNGHVTPGFPYISDTGTIPPESCIFGQILSAGAFLTILLVYIRFHHVKVCNSAFNDKKYLNIVNEIAFWIGIAAAIGVSIVGNFQETNVIEVHMFGAFIGFIGLFVYCSFQAFLSHKLSFALYSTPLMLSIRICLTLLSFTLTVLMIVYSYVASSKYKGKDRQKWMPEDGGFAEHIVSTACEWALAITIMFYLLTFTSDYKRIRVSYPTVIDNRIVLPTTTSKSTEAIFTVNSEF